MQIVWENSNKTGESILTYEQAKELADRLRAEGYDAGVLGVGVATPKAPNGKYRVVVEAILEANS